MGIHQRLHRRCARPSDLRLENPRSHPRHLPRRQHPAYVRNRLHARSPLDKSAALSCTTGRKRECTAGWSYPPKDYGKWEELTFQIVQHCIGRYGKENVEKWLWEVWNEPDIGYWKGTPEEYFQLYTSAVKGVRRALPTAKVGGPATTGPANPKAAAFLKFFLDRCAQTNVPLDFISYHAKGRPSSSMATSAWASTKNWPTSKPASKL